MTNIRRVLSVILVMVLTLSLCVPIANANNNEIKVMLNGKYLNFDVEPQIVNGRTMVPFRAIFEAMGAEVSWNQELWQASGEKGNKSVRMTIDSTEVIVTKDGVEQSIEIDQAPIIIDGRTMVPVRFVAQAFDKIVTWDNDAQTVIILDLEYFVDVVKEKAPNFYEFMTMAYNVPKSLKAKDEFNFELNLKAEEDTSNIAVDGKVDSILNEDNAYIALNLGLEMKSNGKIQEEQVDAKIYLEEDYMIVKTNLFEGIVEEYNGKLYNISEDGILIKYEDLRIPGIVTYQTLMSAALDKTSTMDTVSSLINEELYNENISVKDVEKIMKAFDLTVELIDNNKFTKKSYAGQTIYKWKLDKADIEEYAKNLVVNNIIDKNDVADLVEIGNLVKDFNMVTEVKCSKDYPVSAKFDLDVQMEDGRNKIQMSIDTKETITGINKGPFVINHPNKEDAIDIFEYQDFLKEQNRYNYEEAEAKQELSIVQDAVTMYVFNYIYGSQDDLGNMPTLEEAISTLYNENNTPKWDINNSKKLGLVGIDLEDYKVSPNGLVSLVDKK